MDGSLTPASPARRVKRARGGPGSVLGVLSGRGGSGVSLVSALLAIESARTRVRTLLVDADPWLDVQRVWLGLPPGPSVEALRGRDVDPATLVTPVSKTLDLFSVGTLEPTSPDHRALLRRLPAMFSRYGAVIVDAGSGLDSVSRCIDLKVGSFLAVSRTDAIALACTHALLKVVALRSQADARVLWNATGEDAAGFASAVLTSGARRFGHRLPVVTGALSLDRAFGERVEAGAHLAEALSGSQLIHEIGAPLTLLSPWAAT